MTAGTRPRWLAIRLDAVRMFAKHRQATDPATEVPPADQFPGSSRRVEPFIYTDTQIRALLAAARRIPTPYSAQDACLKDGAYMLCFLVPRSANAALDRRRRIGPARDMVGVAERLCSWRDLMVRLRIGANDAVFS
ncbi:hypothetical protein BN381_430017 [Candidatus Microthrix parvicella RN1]|uniref:Uncharacterized protein n=1 Tax=Candidatus Neomicrothrix parvicella RN1 TaxID=1229780 RepID=R4Z5K9_9ACTN|nr:hypothetical protein BN381_430017 [Candidatus Microthrix parvicella RN1]